MGRGVGPDPAGLQVRDLAASRRFYGESLGLAVAPQSPPGAVVFLSQPIPFAAREPEVEPGAGELCAGLEEDGWRQRGLRSTGRSGGPSLSSARTATPSPYTRTSERYRGV